MISLYGRLYTYRERRERSHLEDFLSEALTDLLMRLPAPARFDVVSELFVPPSLRSLWLKGKSTRDHLTITTQRRLDLESKPDIVIEIYDDPMIIIENKIDAPVHGDQLHRYASWLDKHRTIESGWPGVVCFLTHLTPPPANFFDPTSSVRRHVFKWTQVVSWLKQVTACRGNLAEEPLWKELATNLLVFLKEKEMSSEFATLEDFASAITYIRSSDRMFHTFNSIYGELKKLGGIFHYGQSRRDKQADEDGVDWDGESNVVNGWIYLNTTQTAGDAYFSYGIWLNESDMSPNAQPPFPVGNFAYINVGWDTAFPEAQITKLKLTSNWHVDKEGWSVSQLRPLGDFLSEPEKFAQKMVAWVMSKRAEIEKIATAAPSSPRGK